MSMNDQSSSSSTANNQSNMKRILCLHGRSQSAAIMANKIAGARRKLERKFVLDFLDAPILLDDDNAGDGAEAYRTWWERDDNGKHTKVEEVFSYIVDKTNGEHYDALIGFSQGGILATALAISGKVPGNIKAVVTAGAPMVEEAFTVASKLSESDSGFDIPKLHLAGETDKMVSMSSTKELCERGGNGELITHEKGHLFPTRAVHVNCIIEFLETHI